MEAARFWHPLESGAVRCELCPHRCTITEAHAGRCGSRVNRAGKLYSAVYGYPCATAIDPVEKKPLLHFMPGTTCFSLSCVGCNLSCRWCQNWEISQARPGCAEQERWTPEEVVSTALHYHCPSIAYTYTEPLTYIEYISDIAVLAKENGLRNILVSAGYVNPEPMAGLAPLLDAANIDLKAFSDDVYKRYCGGRLQPVLDTLLLLHRAGVHLEITNLVVPGVNDDAGMIRGMCRWLSDNGLGDCPLHFSRFFPRYQFTACRPTPVKTLQEAAAIASAEGISTVHLGNV